VAELLSVNLAVPRPDPGGSVGTTGIDKRPVDVPVAVRGPGPQPGGLGSGVVGDDIFDRANHGGDDQAVYAYAREDLDWWQGELGRPLTGGMFGENLTTAGLDVTGARIGERWAIGDEVVLEVCHVRIPCQTLARCLGEAHWVKRFALGGRPGAYLRIITPGEVRAGDAVTVLSRPDHDVTVGLTFRALTLESELLPRLLAAPGLPQWVRDKAARKAATT
jgi:MOSC domain-containing protein YiiM